MNAFRLSCDDASSILEASAVAISRLRHAFSAQTGARGRDNARTTHVPRRFKNCVVRALRPHPRDRVPHRMQPDLVTITPNRKRAAVFRAQTRLLLIVHVRQRPAFSLLRGFGEVVYATAATCPPEATRLSPPLLRTSRLVLTAMTERSHRKVQQVKMNRPGLGPQPQVDPSKGSCGA